MYDAAIMARQNARGGTLPQRHWLTRISTSEVFWLVIVCLVGGIVLFPTQTTSLLPLHLPLSPKEVIYDESMLFLGDIMLARNVETLIRANGRYYPLKGIRDLLAEHTVVIGNFEASIPERHIHTPSFTFAFSVMPEMATALTDTGITDVTLANNHAYDFGVAAYEHTKKVLTDAGLTVGGNPQSVSDTDVIYHTIDEVTVAIIPIHATITTPPLSDIRGVLARAAEKSDVQVASIHWGTEYVHTANDTQRTLAHALIDAGADAIIGHHPHVVQNIEEYRGAPIFYSLGNCIFDQYWSTAVQEGLTVALSFTKKNAHYTLIPITSIDTKSAPRPMNRVERVQFLDTLAEGSSPSLQDGIRAGELIELYSKRDQ